jgi:hypothetical protein
MELSGNLADFALSDILQILALSRKTGTVLIENGSIHGRIVLEKGRVVFASSGEQQGLVEIISERTGVKIERTDVFRHLVLSQESCWNFEDMLVESGLLTQGEMAALVKDYVFCSVARLVAVEKGRFGIALNGNDYEQARVEIRLREGIEVNEVLLEAAKKRDEETHCDTIDSDWVGKSPTSDNGNIIFPVFNGVRQEGGILLDVEMSKRGLLFSFLSELCTLSYESEVILTVMRFCSEFTARGVLFSQVGRTLRGVGKFGIECVGHPEGADEVIRSLTIPIDEASIFRDAIVSGRPILDFSEDDHWLRYLRTVLGGGVTGLEGFLIPFSTSVSKAESYIVYGDNSSGGSYLGDVDIIIAFITQASLAIEKILLLKQLEKMGYRESK